LLPNALVRSYFKFRERNRTVSPITNSELNMKSDLNVKSKIQNPKSKIEMAGLFSVALVVAQFLNQTPGRYPARCSSVFGLSSFKFNNKSDCPTCSACKA